MLNFDVVCTRIVLMKCFLKSVIVSVYLKLELLRKNLRSRAFPFPCPSANRVEICNIVISGEINM